MTTKNKPKIDVANVFSLPTAELLKRFAEYNPRIHTEEDIRWTAESVLSIGWATTICINEESGVIVGGHARTLAADFLRQQDQEWFDFKFSEWLEANPDRKIIADKHKHRFTSNFWESCPCIGIKVDRQTERSTNLRLNNNSREGKNDAAKVAALLAQLPDRMQDHAGFDKREAQTIIDAYLVKKSEQPQVDFEPKQYFERPDATVYNAEGNVVDKTELANLDTIPTDWTVELDGNSYTVEDLEEVAKQEQNLEDTLADLDLDSLDSSTFRGASVDKDVAETRIVLLVSKQELEEYRQVIPTIASWLGVDTTSQAAKFWRPKAMMQLVRSGYAQAVKAGASAPTSIDNSEDDE